MKDATPARPEVGLCETCRYTRKLRSGKGSLFFYCSRSEVDEQYLKYPRLPVQQCLGYERQPSLSLSD
ncbi:MAG: hypothetical protein AB7P69_14700 [Candidatus Binatia bacterium]